MEERVFGRYGHPNREALDLAMAQEKRSGGACPGSDLQVWGLEEKDSEVPPGCFYSMPFLESTKHFADWSKVRFVINLRDLKVAT